MTNRGAPVPSILLVASGCELSEERGLEIDQTTVWRWLQRYGPELEERLRRHLKAD
jgi:transposase-like protein